MNAIAEREVRAQVQTGLMRRCVIAQKITECLFGKTDYVYMSWHLQSLPYAEPRAALIEGVEGELIKRVGPDFSAHLLAALTDETRRPALTLTLHEIIGDLADVTLNCMTQAELEALPC